MCSRGHRTVCVCVCLVPGLATTYCVRVLLQWLYCVCVVLGVIELFVSVGIVLGVIEVLCVLF